SQSSCSHPLPIHPPRLHFPNPASASFQANTRKEEPCLSSITASHEARPSSAAGNGAMEHSHESTPLLPAAAFRAVHESISSGIAREGESGQSGFHPWHFLNVLWRSSCTASMVVNVLWPIVLVAIFAAAYVAVVPSANLLGFSGQEFSQKMPKVAGILIETTFGSIVEIILFLILVSKHDSSSSAEKGDEGNLVPIIQAAILGSILTNLLLCLGLYFFFGGIQVPGGMAMHEKFTNGTLQGDVLRISWATSIALIIAFLLYIWYRANSQRSIFDEVIQTEEHRDVDREADMEKPKFTLTETTIAVVISLVLVTLLLIFLGQVIEHPVDPSFEIFIIVLLVLSIIVGNFLRDGELNWPEGACLW
ncbi:hypothetical protein LX32DRAFT_716993, partial [Colletotrichum zoysiae]